MHNTRLVMEQQHDDMGLRQKAQAGIRTGLNQGTLIIYAPWKKRNRWVRGVNDAGKAVYQKREAFNGQDWENIPIWRFHSDDCVDPDDMMWFSREFETSKENLQELINAHKGIRAAQTRDLKDVKWEGEYNSEGRKISEYLKVDRAYNLRTLGTKVHVDDYWGIHPTKKNPNDPTGTQAMPIFYRIMIVNGRDWVIQTPNPFWHGRLPICVVRFLPNEEQFYGIGMGELLRQKWMMINKRRNLMTDILTMSLFGMWQRQGATPGRHNQRIRLYPGRVFDSMIDGVMQQLRVETSALKPGMAMDQLDIEEMRAVTAATSNIQGLAQGGTATEIRNIAQESARRIATFATIFGVEGIRKFLTLQAMNNAQFLPDEFAVGENTVEGVRGRLIDKDQIFKRPRFRMKIATDLEFAPRIQRNLNQMMANMATMLQADPRLVPILEPMILQLGKKAMVLFGENPFESISEEKIRQILTMPPPGMGGPPTGPGGNGRGAVGAGAPAAQPTQR
jgi:hypothetical protein